MSSPPIAGPSNQGKVFNTDNFIWEAICDGLIDMREPWVEGSRYQNDKVSERGCQNLRFCLFLFFVCSTSACRRCTTSAAQATHSSCTTMPSSRTRTTT